MIRIRTYKDMVEAVTPDNIDNFLKDFEIALKVSMQFKHNPKIYQDGFYWSDDKKPEICIEINAD